MVVAEHKSTKMFQYNGDEWKFDDGDNENKIMNFNDNNNETNKNIINSNNTMVTNKLDVENNDTKIVDKITNDSICKGLNWGVGERNYTPTELFIIHLAPYRAKH